MKYESFITCDLHRRRLAYKEIVVPGVILIKIKII
jgi:hypothetical protein